MAARTEGTKKKETSPKEAEEKHGDEPTSDESGVDDRGFLPFLHGHGNDLAQALEYSND